MKHISTRNQAFKGQIIDDSYNRMPRENNSAQGRLSLRPGIVHLQHNKVSIHRSLSYIDQYVDFTELKFYYSISQ